MITDEPKWMKDRLEIESKTRILDTKKQIRKGENPADKTNQENLLSEEEVFHMSDVNKPTTVQFENEKDCLEKQADVVYETANDV